MVAQTRTKNVDMDPNQNQKKDMTIIRKRVRYIFYKKIMDYKIIIVEVRKEIYGN